MSNHPVLADLAPAPRAPGGDRRASVRHVCDQEALSRPLELPDAISWGAKVHDVSRGGLGLLLCYPFKPGTFLAVDLRCGQAASRTVLVRVVHATDQADGTWSVGCEFAAPLSDAELAALL
jgi:hypothetical protein